MNSSNELERSQSDYPQRVKEYWTEKTWKKVLELEEENMWRTYTRYKAWYKLLSKKNYEKRAL